MQDHTTDLSAALAEHGPFLTRLSRSLLRDSHGAEDLLQDTWLAALEKAPASGGGVGGWLGTTLRNRAISGFRRRAARGLAAPIDALDVDSAVPSGAPTPAETAEQLEAQRTVHAALTGLSEPRRTTLMLRFHGGLTVPEIARRMGTAVPTVKSRLASGLAELRQGLDAEFGGGDEGRAAWGALLVPVATTHLPGEAAEAAAAATASKAAAQAAPVGGGGLGGGLGLFVAVCGAALLVAIGWRAMDGGSGLGLEPDAAVAALGSAQAQGAELAPSDSLSGRQPGGRPSAPSQAASPSVATGQELAEAASAGDPSGPYVVLRDPEGRAVQGMLWGTSSSEPSRTYTEESGRPLTDERGRAWLPPHTRGMPEVLRKPWNVFPIAPLVPTLATVVEPTSSGATDVPVPSTAPLEVRLLDGAGAPWQGSALVRLRPQDPEYSGLHFQELGPGEAGEPVRWAHVGRGVPYEVDVRWLGDWNDVLVAFDGIGAGEPGPVHEIRITNRRVVLVGRLVDPRGAALGDVGFVQMRSHVRSDANGYVRIPVPGDPSTLGGTEIVLTGAVGGAHWNADGSARVPDNVEAGDVEVGDIVMVERPVTVSGRLVTAEGEGLPHRDLTVVMRKAGGEWQDSGVGMMSAKDGSFLLTTEVGDGIEELAIQVERTVAWERTYVLRKVLPFERGVRQMEVRMERE